jgi:hypothetical protein
VNQANGSRVGARHAVPLRCFLVLVLLLAACAQPYNVAPTPTTSIMAALPGAAVTVFPTQTPRGIGPSPPSPISSPVSAATQPGIVEEAETVLPLDQALGTTPVLSALGTPLSPDADEQGLIPTLPLMGIEMPADAILVGQSAGGRAIWARRFGTGERIIMLVGGMHGGWEANTVALVNELIAHFDANPDDVLSGVSLLLIPAANPDGIPYGRTPEGRFNANGVDLNRNWSCGWSASAVWRDQPVNPGAIPFSEPETRALAAFIGQVRPSVALFYHSAADGVFAGNCGERGGATVDSWVMAGVYGEAAGYSYGQAFSAYPVTGTAASWADGQGIASADVELRSWSESEFDANLRGVMALQRWILGG